MTECGRDSSVGIATGYGLDVPGIEIWWGRDIPEKSSLIPWPPSLLYEGYRFCYPEIKRTDTSLTTHRLIVSRLSTGRAISTVTYLQCSKGQPLPLHNTANRLIYLIRVSDAVAGPSGRAV